jgi:adenosine/AMP kinase
MEIRKIDIENPKTHEIIIGQGNFTVKTIDDLYDAIYSAAPNAKFGVAMNEAKPRLVRVVGNSEEPRALAAKAALQISAGHVFVVFMKDAYPIQVIPRLRAHPCVANIYCATSNPLQVLVARTELGAAVVGVVDGSSATAIETGEQRAERRGLVKKFGFLPE